MRSHAKSRRCFKSGNRVWLWSGWGGAGIGVHRRSCARSCARRSRSTGATRWRPTTHGRRDGRSTVLGLGATRRHTDEQTEHRNTKYLFHCPTSERVVVPRRNLRIVGKSLGAVNEAATDCLASQSRLLDRRRLPTPQPQQQQAPGEQSETQPAQPAYPSLRLGLQATEVEPSLVEAGIAPQRQRKVGLAVGALPQRELAVEKMNLRRQRRRPRLTAEQQQ
jgi:hypothetical protein